MMLSNISYVEKPPFLLPAPRSVFPSGSLFFTTARQALYHYLQGKAGGYALMPDFVAQGVYDPFVKLGFKIRFYHIDRNLQIDISELRAICAESPPAVFVYIHFFGIYLDKQRDDCLGLLSPSTLVVEDCAHTLPHDLSLYKGQVKLFSLQKLAGLCEGGVLAAPDANADLIVSTDESSRMARNLRRKIRNHTVYNMFFTRWNAPRWIRVVIARISLLAINYYSYLCRHYPEITSPMSNEQKVLINRLDFGAIYKRRSAIAQHYFENIPSRFLLDIPVKSFTSQSLIGFPIIVDDQKRFGHYLRSNGICGFILKEHWWFTQNPQASEILNRHYLLPQNHYLSDQDVDRIIKAVSEYH